MCRMMGADEGQLYRHLIAVSDRKQCERPFEEQIRRVCSHHPAAFILREKDLDETAYEELAFRVRLICEEYQVPFFLHGHWALARQWDWPDIHLPLAALREIRSLPGKSDQVLVRGAVSVSVHSVAEAVEAERLGATCVIAGHIYETDCKKGLAPRGMGFLKEVCRAVSVPVYGIGGIRPEWGQMEELLAAGAAGGCVMSGMMRL